MPDSCGWLDRRPADDAVGKLSVIVRLFFNDLFCLAQDVEIFSDLVWKFSALFDIVCRLACGKGSMDSKLMDATPECCNGLIQRIFRYGYSASWALF